MTEKLADAGIAAETAAEVGREWASYLEPMLPLAERLAHNMADPDDPLLRHELYRSIVTEIATGYLSLLYADPKHPDFWPFTTTAFNCYLNNPDDDYYATPVDDDGVYKIAGYRGTVKTIDFQTGMGSFLPTGVVDEHNLGKTLANYDLDLDATIGDDGYFEVVLSPERPADWKGDWWELHPEATNVLNRQISYDWAGEIDGRYGIERLDQPAMRPRPTVSQIEEGLKGLPAWIEGSIQASCDFAGFIRQKIGVNTLDYWELTSHLAIPTQGYVYGGFDLEPDDALVISFQVPKEVRYWSFHLGDHLGFIHDWMHHQTIINGHTAVVDDDRTCRVVVSAQDPGTPNWLDTIGHKEGGMSIRWERCDAYPETHEVTKVKIGEVRDHFPDDTPVVSPEERDATIRKRRLGAQMQEALVTELDLDQILAAAKEMTGLEDHGEPDMLPGLQILVDSYNREGNLRDPDGVEGTRLSLIGRVANRLGVNAILSQHPEIFDEEISGPIVIVGLPRTGTSKLHRMMAASPDLQSLPLWKIMNPAPMGPTPPDGEDPRIAIAEQVSTAMRENYPDFFAGHPMIPRDPDEEIWMMDLVVRGTMPCYTATIPTYREWAEKQSSDTWYEFLRKLLQMFQWQDGSRSEPWLLKAPENLGHLGQLFETFPGATIVHTHRDPVVALTSIAVLATSSRRMYTDEPDPEEMGRFALTYWSAHLRKYLEQRERLEETHPFVDIPYPEVVNDSMGAIDKIFAAAGFDVSDPGRDAMRAWEADNPQHKFGKHTYALEEVGLEENEVRASFADYVERFGSLLEPQSGSSVTA